MNPLDQVARLSTDTSVTVVSTRTMDHLPGDGEGPRAIPGGPATYIPRVLDALQQPWILLTGEQTDVTVVQDGGTEDYIIPALPLIPLPARAPSKLAIVSPIMQEVDAEEISSWDCALFVDIQGFVRVPNKRFKDVHELFDLRHLIERATLVKAGREEVRRLDPPSQQALRGTPLLLTGGATGAELIIDGAVQPIPADNVAVEDAIGAGDTFLACFTVQLLRRTLPVEAAHIASAYVSQVLRSRSNSTS